MKPLTINLLWVIGILLLIITAFSVVTPSGELLRDYITFAASIASILLALVAIFYAFVSNGSLTSTLNDVRSAASSLAAETSKINDASSGLSKEAEEVIRRLENLPDKVSEFRGELSEKIDKLSKTNRTEKTGGKESGPHSVSIGYNGTKYLMAQAYKAGKSFAATEVLTGEGLTAGAEYANAVIETLRVHPETGYRIDGIEGRYFIQKLGGKDADQVIKNVLEDLEKYPNETFEKIVKAVDEYFGVEPSESTE